MAKIERLFNILLKINTKKQFTIKELSDEFNVSTRTISRDLNELCSFGIPLYSERGPHGGFRLINQNNLLPSIAFSHDEAISIFFACQSLQYHNSLPFENDVKSALDKFYHYLPMELKKQIDSMSKRIIFLTPKRKERNLFLKETMNAAINQEVIKIEYESKKGTSKRIIQPIGVYSCNGYWYLPAYCFMRKQNRLFRVDRIVSFEIKHEYHQKKDFTNLSLDRWFNTIDSKPSELVKLRVSLTREGVLKCDFNPWVRENIQMSKDGSGTINTYLNKEEIPYMSEFFFGLGANAKVQEPVEMVDLIKRHAINLLNMYN
ncbi:transcriptional regulator [Bacillus thuringiensis]|uniref:helix-turn-helix transcriptional regulator n=1 Tax=Bacillus thuringiensis TaxID=1428 RepID=UPI000BF78EB1|nr:YafY family protein [Bacillus thuringiensis]PEV50798.1 transcriptional regulator [Bacillus thuringiensis]PFR65786.1 transcriptional regulator [Bacillus thuringiensis]PFT77385.1 transcriptional regulator [Bacillus thuringiensis]PFV87970.1 transcriptional regulator [Bacillus thuringiensis]